MTNIIDWIKSKYKNNIINKIIIINVAIFILTSFLGLGFLAVSMNPTEVMTHPWTLVTHMFAHSGLMHILFNMVTLYFAGNMFLSYFSNKQFLGLYFIGSMLSSILTIIIWNLFGLGCGIAVGASAAIMAILIAVCVYKPNETVHLMFLGAVKLKYIAIVLVAIDLISMPESNTGGHIAHLTGALFGVIFALAMKNKKVVNGHGNSGKGYSVDKILDKISKKGLNKLTDDERTFLKNYYK